MRLTLLRLLALWAGFFLFYCSSSAQGFSFNCTRDTLIAGCSPNACFTLKSLLPDIHGLTDSYTINPISEYGSTCFPVYSSPSINGIPTNLTIDDRYSAAINIGFPFVFYGNTYNDLIVSTNGYLSFDISKATLASHWQITTTGGVPMDLPNTFYDRALIMGPYHDLNPNYPTSPTERIQYVVTGSAPYRRWILSFYKVPLFTNAGGGCNFLIDNTHQIILNESTGIIEVLIFDKQICTGWNQGRAMVGLQNFNKDQGIMAPGRKASDAPWGTVGMNESWRFVPNGGPSLFRRVELYNLAGTLLGVGTTNNLGNGSIEASFPNICPTAGTTTSYIVKSFYTKIDDPAVEIFGTDTVRVTKSAPTDLGALAAATPTTCGPPTGIITVTVPNGTATYSATLDGVTTVSGPSPLVFNNVSQGVHNIVVIDPAAGCSSIIRQFVGLNNNLATNLTSTSTSCAGASNGSITVTPTNGTSPYTFTLNPGGVVQPGATSTTFNNLAAGTYSITFTDASGCTLSPPYVATVSPGAGLNANLSSAPTSCAGATNGSLTVTPSSGTGPYIFTLNPGGVVQTGATGTTFNNLAAGTYNVNFTDATGCSASASFVAAISDGAGITSNISNAPTTCPGVNNGTVTVTPTSGTGPYTFTLNPGAIVQTGPTATTFNGLATGTYTVLVKDANNCTTSSLLSTTITAGAGLNGTVSAVSTACPGVSNGTVTATATTGTGPYTFTLNPGSIVQTGATNTTFNGLAAGNYTVIFRDALGCTTTSPLNITVSPGIVLAATSSQTATTCSGATNGSVTITPSNGTGPFTFVLDGAITQSGATSTTFNGLAAGNHTVTITDANGCNTGPAITVNVASGAPLAATSSQTATTCSGAMNGSITITPSNGNGPFTFGLDGTITQTGATSTTFNALAAGNHTITITDVNGCNTSPAINVNVASGAPLAATTSQTATTCAGANNGTITVTPTNGNGPFSFLLDGTTTQVGATATTFNNLAAGNHTIRITDANGCTSTPVLIVTVATGGTLSANAAPTATSCSGANNGTVNITPTNGSGPYTFVLDGATTQTGATTTFINLPAGPHSVVITDAAGCVSNPISITIAAGAVLSTTAIHSDVLCNGGATGSITITPPGGPGPFQYSLDNVIWQAGNIFPGLAAANYTVYFRETSSGCQGQLTQTVAQPAVLNATSNGIPVICNGQSNGIITITTSGGKTPYQYSINGGTTWQAGNTFNVAAGTYTITIRDVNLCTTTQTLTITEPAALSASITSTANATCNGGNDGKITIAANGGNSGYQYSSDGITYQASNILSVAPGTYTATIKDNLGCLFTIPNVVVGLTNDLTFTAPPSPTICEGTSTQLQITSNALQYAWTPVTGLSSASVYNPTVNPIVTTTYTVTITYGRCSADVPLTVNVNTAPIPNAGVNGFICYGQNYQLQGSGGTGFKWSPSTFLDTASVFNPVATPDRTVTYTLSVSDANGCNSLVTDDVIVDVTPPIRVNTFPSDTIAYAGDQFQLLATSVATDYIWTPSTGLNNVNIANPVVTAGVVGDEILYKVTASTQAGCKGDGYVRVKVYKGPELYVPTAFTPNNDGMNDKFFPFPVGITEIKYFQVFNRWGQMVFSTKKLNDGWDGKLEGREQASGVYVWRAQGISKDNRVITKTGTVMLIR